MKDGLSYVAPTVRYASLLINSHQTADSHLLIIPACTYCWQSMAMVLRYSDPFELLGDHIDHYGPTFMAVAVVDGCE